MQNQSTGISASHQLSATSLEGVSLRKLGGPLQIHPRPTLFQTCRLIWLRRNVQPCANATVPKQESRSLLQRSTTTTKILANELAWHPLHLLLIIGQIHKDTSL